MNQFNSVHIFTLKIILTKICSFDVFREDTFGNVKLIWNKIA